jgi:hypothetical protein
VPGNPVTDIDAVAQVRFVMRRGEVVRNDLPVRGTR